MNCIIIDDDELSRTVLEKFIKRTGFLNLMNSFKNAPDSIPYINRRGDIDLIFLDVEMPEMTGIDFMKSLKNLPQVIIISAKQKYALEAFEYDVTDYLLKPISYPRLYKAVDKAYNRYKENNNTKDKKDGFFIKNNSTLVRIKYTDIYWVEALENYVGINTKDSKYTIHFTMKAIENELPSSIFTRVHRSFIVNINKIDIIEENTIVLKVTKGIKTIPIGKSYRDKLMDDINLVAK
ncbi:MAG: DNA-binding response regulator [Bacteroidia bacterium]|nr:MAG: DNA-binding response regulator [Bacteroidia bacterium]